MKLFISMPMRNRKPEEIEALMEKYHKFCETVVFDKKVELVKSFDPERKFKYPIEALVESLQMLQTADFVFFAPGWEDARGCRIENAVCEAYGIEHTDGNHWSEYLEKDLESIALRECPHCGADNGFLSRMSEVNADTNNEVHYVMCFNCGARSGRTGNKVSADIEWNRRSTDNSSDTASLSAVDVRMEDCESLGDTEGKKEAYSTLRHKEKIQEILDVLSKEVLSRAKEDAADETTLRLINAHFEMMLCLGMATDPR